MFCDDTFDVAIIGGGVAGCAILREFALTGLKSVLVERAPDLLAGASKGNSAILHTGFDAKPGSLELACLREGYRLYREIHHRFNLPLIETGAIVAAWTDEQKARLPDIVARAHANGVTDVMEHDAAWVRDREPNLAPDVKGGVFVPGEAVIDPWSAPYAYALQAVTNGGTVRRGATVADGKQQQNNHWVLNLSDGTELRAGTVINCAGLYGDIVESIVRKPPFTIKPRKGQFVVYDKPASKLVNAIILPVPTERTKGVVVTRTAFGNLLVGPTAEDQDERDRASVEEDTLRMLHEKGSRMIPALVDAPITMSYAGLRPATEHADYQIECLPERRWITVAGIRSTGLAAALGIAAHVGRLYGKAFGSVPPSNNIAWPVVPNISEGFPRPYMEAGRSEIVCHCELVTRLEIETALTGPLPAGSIGGLRRRTRCMMGQCGGFYCTRRIMEIVNGRIPELVEPNGSPSPSGQGGR